MPTQINTITDVLNLWAQQGVFAYVLPFLLVFAVVFGILNKTKILGDNRGVQAVIGISVGLMSLMNDYVSEFFEIIFPYTGIGISVLLVGLILLGLVSGESWAKWIWLSVGGIGFIVIVLTSFTEFSWFGGGYGWGYSWPALLTAIILIGMLLWVVIAGGKPKSSSP